MYKFTTVLLLFSTAFLTSCEPDPVADFSTDKTTYYPGETIQLRNTSTDADSYKWTMPGGQTSNYKDINFETMPYDWFYFNNNELSFTLEAFSESGDKSDQRTKTVYMRIR